ncbi:hypothetical protein TNIN_417271 [Trichonephila inaurata madagascariensis]|uniref:Uncharacterized protein n=1 Tax=Trichonephila inaurata madagascariensis TaxID=2747483 RepID=A0A8X6XCJ4_9ARAC|nr:hypothetical protein TNIN_417271 [Trichonephila inaurata madagascariensis]
MSFESPATLGATREHNNRGTWPTTKWSLFKPETAIQQTRVGLILPIIRVSMTALNHSSVTGVRVERVTVTSQRGKQCFNFGFLPLSVITWVRSIHSS